jgi:cytochrome b561
LSPPAAEDAATPAYDRFSRLLHWAVAVFVLVQFATGWTWGYFERGSEPRFYLFRTHLFSGYVILVLAVVRVMWRSVSGFPALPAGMGPATALVARATHLLLYTAILVQPLVGIVVTTAYGKTLGRVPNQIHITLAYVIFGLVMLHVAGALWHHFVRRDTVLSRMLPGVGRGRVTGA